MIRTVSPAAGRDEGHAHDGDARRRNQLVDLDHVRVAATTTKTRPRSRSKAPEELEHKFEDELMAVAEQLIVKGKEQGYLTPDDVLAAFPEMVAEPEIGRAHV